MDWACWIAQYYFGSIDNLCEKATKWLPLPSNVWLLDKSVVILHVLWHVGDQVVEVVVEPCHIGEVGLVSGQVTVQQVIKNLDLQM